MNFKKKYLKYKKKYLKLKGGVNDDNDIYGTIDGHGYGNNDEFILIPENFKLRPLSQLRRSINENDYDESFKQKYRTIDGRKEIFNSDNYQEFGHIYNPGDLMYNININLILSYNSEPLLPYSKYSNSGIITGDFKDFDFGIKIFDKLDEDYKKKIMNIYNDYFNKLLTTKFDKIEIKIDDLKKIFNTHMGSNENDKKVIDDFYKEYILSKHDENIIRKSDILTTKKFNLGEILKKINDRYGDNYNKNFLISSCRTCEEPEDNLVINQCKAKYKYLSDNTSESEILLSENGKPQEEMKLQLRRTISENDNYLTNFKEKMDQVFDYFKLKQNYRNKENSEFKLSNMDKINKTLSKNYTITLNNVCYIILFHKLKEDICNDVNNINLIIKEINNNQTIFKKINNFLDYIKYFLYESFIDKFLQNIFDFNKIGMYKQIDINTIKCFLFSKITTNSENNYFILYDMYYRKERKKKFKEYDIFKKLKILINDNNVLDKNLYEKYIKLPSEQ